MLPSPLRGEGQVGGREKIESQYLRFFGLRPQNDGCDVGVRDSSGFTDYSGWRKVLSFPPSYEFRFAALYRKSALRMTSCHPELVSGSIVETLTRISKLTAFIKKFYPPPEVEGIFCVIPSEVKYLLYICKLLLHIPFKNLKFLFKNAVVVNE